MNNSMLMVRQMTLVKLRGSQTTKQRTIGDMNARKGIVGGGVNRIRKENRVSRSHSNRDSFKHV